MPKSSEREGLFEVDKKHRFILLNYLLPTYRGSVNYYKSVHHPIPTLPVNFQNKSLYKLSFQLSFLTYSLLVQTEGESKRFLGRVQQGGPHCNIITWLISKR